MSNAAATTTTSTSTTTSSSETVTGDDPIVASVDDGGDEDYDDEDEDEEEAAGMSGCNGFLCGGPAWPRPVRVMKSEVANRADQGNTIKASEYMDPPKILYKKMELVAGLVKGNSMCVAYTGAGLSKSSGIPDYATKGASVTGSKGPALKTSLDAKPTFAHLVLAAMERAGYLHYYVQQNHDGLPQKAGYPQWKINEIHGAWFDPSNPVVKFSGSLRNDLFEGMCEIEKKVDLCLCLGTSLSGMNADRIATKTAKRSLLNPPKATGTVIINLQRTHLDSHCCIRVWALLDEAFRILAELLSLEVLPAPSPPFGSDCSFKLPFDAETGTYDPSKSMILDLRIGSKVVIIHPNASNFKSRGSVVRKDDQGCFVIDFENDRRRRLGWWWITAAQSGKIKQLPLINAKGRNTTTTKPKPTKTETTTPTYTTTVTNHSTKPKPKTSSS
ncbi:NAD-dependent protein deacetylase sirtuin-7 [Pelomyxa schiedti]|nr:NAD-dependent protein deacetylase sirtuin-7 [Pelomyxa schiedti]